MALKPRAANALQCAVQRAAISQEGANPEKPRVKLESLVMADQHAAVNAFSGLVHTACHTPKVGNR
jgi:hypothetical protein